MRHGPYKRRSTFCELEVTLASLYHRLKCCTSALGTVLCSLSARYPVYQVRFRSCLLQEERLLPVSILRYEVWDFVLASLSPLRSVLRHIFKGLAFYLCSLSCLSGLLRTMLAACGPVPTGTSYVTGVRSFLECAPLTSEVWH